MPLKQCSGFEVADLCKKTQPIMWHPVSLWTKASTKLVFPPKPLFVQRISLYHIGIAQLLAYYRTADSGDVMPPPCQCPQCGFTKQLEFLDPLMLGKLNTSVTLKTKSQRLLQRLDSCFCLTFFDVVLLTSTHPLHPRMCLYYACVCIYMCVYIHTVYVYIYKCSICNLW